MIHSMKILLSSCFLSLFISLQVTANPLDDPLFPVVDGTVNVVVEDSVSGGWFIGGEFSFVDGISANNIARIKSNYNVDSNWNPGTNGPVLSMLLSKDTLYVAGNFSTVDYQAKSDSEERTILTRNNVASINRINGKPNTWNPDVNGPVHEMVLDGNCAMILLKGEFSEVGGVPYENEAFISTSSAPNVWTIDESVNAQDIENSDPEAPTVWVSPAGGMFSRPLVVTFSCNAGAGKAENEGCTIYCDLKSFPGLPTDEELAEFADPSVNSEFRCDIRRRLGSRSFQEVVYLKYFAANDENGKTGEVQTKVFMFDPKAPLTTACPSTTVFDSKTKKITLHCSDTGQGCGKTYYSIDGSYPTVDNALVYEGPFELDGDNTNYIVRFFSEDKAGNQEDVKQESYIGIYGGFGLVSPLSILLPLLILVYRFYKKGTGL